MENYFGLVAAVVLVVIVAVAFAIASNRADEASSANKQRNKQKSNKDKKSNKKGKQKNKPLPNVVFKSDGKIENEDESMIDLIQGTAKYYAQEAKQASDAAAKKLQAAAAETKATADKAVKGAKNAAKKVVAAVDEQLEEGTYTSVSRPRNNTRAKPETKDSAGENVVPQFSGKKKGNKAFLKSDIPEPKEKGQPGERRQKREKKQDSTENAGDKPAVDGEAKPQRQRNRPPRQDDAAKTEGDANAVEGEEDRRPRQPRGPPKEPKEKKPPVFQPIPVALTLDTNDVLSKKNLDEMLGYMSSHYRTQETVFSRLAEVSSQRIARDTRRYKDQAVAKKLRPVNTLSGEQIIVKILSKLSLRDIVAVSQVDQFFSKITRGDALWKALGARDFGITKDNKDNKDKQNNNKKDNKKPPRAKALYRDKYDESKGRKNAKPAAKPKSSDSPKTEVNKPAATGSPSEDAEKKTQKKGEKKKKDTTA